VSFAEIPDSRGARTARFACVCAARDDDPGLAIELAGGPLASTWHRAAAS
jgi:hypothetical protein